MAPRKGGKRNASNRSQVSNMRYAASSSTPDPTTKQSSSGTSGNAKPHAELSNDVQPHEPSDGAIPSPATPSAGFDVNHDNLQLIARIQSALQHAQSPSPHALISHSHFTLQVTDPPSTPLHLLRTSPLATLIASTPTHEVYSLPIPVAPPAFRRQSEQWWAGRSPAEIRAGPIRDAEDVRLAEREIRSRAGRRRKSLTAKNGLLKQQEEYMLESLRRQTLRLPMEGAVSREVEREAMERYGVEWEDSLAELGGEGDAGAGGDGAVEDGDEVEMEEVDGDGEGESEYSEWENTDDRDYRE
ncbi:hypothetical protein P171DRAFT_438975 [Karstenula rhodostoma CBS 690.94]|uniref:Uncharacterized protein n=1 Tax=Karstenula rhodostoma CBS 690.94 TaxID=1392251 RepID=A0A9P4UHJ6_9PLEO|nr:hypothetical protein P171DRAFT_438975 [Karstenula rhodostoma CBS 690.94]